MKKQLIALFGLMIAASTTSTGCLVVDDGRRIDGNGCYDDCNTAEVCETYCDSWSCWDECFYDTTCTTTCTETEVINNPPVNNEPLCYDDLDCVIGKTCEGGECVVVDTNADGKAGLCQTCETSNDCYEANSLCIELNSDQTSRTGEKVCSRTCEYNTDCPINFECVRVSAEAGAQAQCLPKKAAGAEKRTCNAGADLECVRATDCGVGESCVGNSCSAPNSPDVECSSNKPCAGGLTCREFKCVDTSEPQCTTQADCRNNQACVDGVCESAPTTCVFNEECDGGKCVNGTCADACTKQADCGSLEICRSGLCEAVECRASADCGAGQVCVNAECTPGCNKNIACAAGYTCSSTTEVRGYCKVDSNVQCRNTAECARDEVCSAGKCEKACSCNQQCATGEICNMSNGVCEAPGMTQPAPAECDDNCDCPSGKTCSADKKCV
jgi:hypothetical protein